MRKYLIFIKKSLSFEINIKIKPDCTVNSAFVFRSKQASGVEMNKVLSPSGETIQHKMFSNY